MLTVYIDDSLIDQAEQMGREVETHVASYGPNHTGLIVPGRYATGYVGELALVKLCEERGIRCDHHPRTDGVPDSGCDVTLYYQGRPVPVDVKTLGNHYLRDVCITRSQIDRMRRCVLTACRWDRMTNGVTFSGFIQSSDFVDHASLHQVDARSVYSIGFSDLPVSMEKLDLFDSR